MRPSFIKLRSIIISIFQILRGARIAPRRGAVGPTHCQSHCPPGPSCELTLVKAQFFALNMALKEGHWMRRRQHAIARTISEEG